MMTKHKQANVYKELCTQADAVARNKKHDLPQGYSILGTPEWNKKSNFKAVAYQNGDELVISYVGTDPKSIKDHGANLKMDTGGVYESELDERMADNKIPSRAEAHEKSLKGESVYVEEYTKADGTKVSGYYRRI